MTRSERLYRIMITQLAVNNAIPYQLLLFVALQDRVFCDVHTCGGPSVVLSDCGERPFDRT